jgi:hypothetical protein
MTLPELHAVLDRLGVELTARGDKLHYKAKSGSLTPEIKAALAAHKRGLLALLVRADDGTDTAGPPASEPITPSGILGGPPGPVGSDGPGPPPASRSWRRVVALWPDGWRRIWGCRANEWEDRGKPWDVAEWSAFWATVHDLAAAEDRGEVPASSYPDPAAPGLSDDEAVAAIDRALGDIYPAPARRSDRGPRDVRHGDWWLPWHFREGAL